MTLILNWGQVFTALLHFDVGTSYGFEPSPFSRQSSGSKNRFWQFRDDFSITNRHLPSIRCKKRSSILFWSNVRLQLAAKVQSIPADTIFLRGLHQINSLAKPFAGCWLKILLHLRPHKETKTDSMKRQRLVNGIHQFLSMLFHYLGWQLNDCKAKLNFFQVWLVHLLQYKQN